ncbi:MAG: hypothetical protein HY873_10115 [Chloroflexi bacterium]|nr:hypothetical protein [Chloroflexota bacterium]
MEFEDRPQLPLSTRRKVLVAIGSAMFLGQLAAAALLAEPTTGAGDASIGVLALMWAGCLGWSVVTTLLVIRQADIPDVFTASLLVTVAPFAVFALLAAIAVRGTDQETDVVSAMFFGITSGALTAVLVWFIAMAVARVLRLPTTAGLVEDDAA